MRRVVTRLSEPINDRDAAILAARRRGFTQRAIADGLGITHQAVSQRLQVYEPIKARIRIADRVGRREFICPICAKRQWVMPLDPRQFCGQKCMGKASRRLSEDDVRWAIEMRVHGAMTWTTIAKKTGFPMQTLQKRIWAYLYNSGGLTLPVVRDIWKPTTSEQRHTPSWMWLENSLGMTAR